METPSLNILTILVIIWGLLTAVLILYLARYKLLELKEEDQLFLDKAEEHMAQEQREIVARLEKMDKPIKVLGILSGVLLLVIAGVWVWRGLQSF